MYKWLTFCYFVIGNNYQLATMKKKYWLATCFSLLLITSCGSNSEKDNADKGKEYTEAVNEDEPMADSEQRDTVNVRLGNHTYKVSLYRYPDKKQALVVDELDQKFYDNSVDINILRDGVDFMKKTVSKDAFLNFLSESDYKSSVLLGMNCDTARCERSSLCFTAQVGQAGEGPAFLVMVPVDGGPVSITRDNLLEDIGYK